MSEQHETRARAVKIIVGICFAFIVIAYLPLAYYRIRSLVHSLGDSTVIVEKRTQQLWEGDVEEKLKAAAVQTKEQWKTLQEYQASTQQINQFANEVQRAVTEQTLTATSTESDSSSQSDSQTIQ